MVTIDERIKDYEYAKKHLIIRAGLTFEVEKRLTDVPHINLYDMAIYYGIMIDEGCVLINTSLLKQYGITWEELQEDVQINAPKNFPVEICSIKEKIKGMFGEMYEMMDEQEFCEDLFVASCKDTFGAGCLFYPKFMSQAAKLFGGDFFVLPSSIHEVLLMPDDGSTSTGEELDAMVQQVNANELEPGERLSNYAYHFNTKDGIIERATEWSARRAER